MKQISAVSWLLEQIENKNGKEFTSYYTEFIEQAKEMEKDNVCDAWDDGYDKGMRDRIEKISNPVGNAEQYYNETYKTKTIVTEYRDGSIKVETFKSE
jgi:hypothetical protein